MDYIIILAVLIAISTLSFLIWSKSTYKKIRFCVGSLHQPGEQVVRNLQPWVAFAKTFCVILFLLLLCAIYHYSKLDVFSAMYDEWANLIGEGENLSFWAKQGHALLAFIYQDPERVSANFNLFYLWGCLIFPTTGSLSAMVGVFRAANRHGETSRFSVWRILGFGK